MNEGKTEHHIWCNFWGTPLETCRQCAGLYERYPRDGMTENELAAKHFPNAIARTVNGGTVK